MSDVARIQDFEALVTKTKETKIIKTEKYVEFLENERSFSVKIMYEDLSSIGEEIYFPYGSPYSILYMKLGVLSTLGSNKWKIPAEKGVNFDAFFSLIEKLYEEIPEDYIQT